MKPENTDVKFIIVFNQNDFNADENRFSKDLMKEFKSEGHEVHAGSLNSTSVAAQSQ